MKKLADLLGGSNLLTHVILAHTMPFNCGWLSDPEDDTKACEASVIIGSAMYALRRYDLGAKLEKEPYVQ